MSDKLPEDRLNELLPCLGPVAELLSVSNEFDRQSLIKVMSDVGINWEEWALAEMELWGNILCKCRDKSHNRGAIIAELRSRGVPEFPAMLAYESAKPKPLTIEPKFVDFGCLKFGEGASITLQASGEPVVKAIASNRLKITLLKSGPAKTLVKLQLSSGTSGESIREEIVLRGSTGEVRVTVTARWEEERPRLSYCPVCKKKSLFWNYLDRIYECLNLECKATGPDLDKLVSPYKRR